MRKKLTAAVTALSVLVVGGAGFLFLKAADIIHFYPEATYLDDSEAQKRPIYQGFSENEKAVYTALLNGIKNREEEIALPFDISGQMYERLYCILEKQEGGTFYIDSSYYNAEKIRSATIIYRQPEGDFDTMSEAVEKAEKEALSGIREDMDDYEKALYIHDYLINKCDYVDGGSDSYGSTVYGCLVENKANCEGYAKAFGMLAGECGLENILITGVTNKGENHAWNQVKINDEWYNIDVTWDDVTERGVRWMYFLCDDDSFGKTHYQENRFFKPFECESTKDNYYMRENLYAPTHEAAKEILIKKYQEGAKLIDLKFPDSYVYYDFKSEYIDNGSIYRILFDLDDTSTKQISLSLTENVEEHCMTIEVVK